MKFPAILVFAHAKRNWFRSVLTLGSVFVAIFVFGGMRTIIDSLEATVSGTNSRRMITESAVSLFVNLPAKMGQEIKGVPNVREVTHWTWFGGTYVNPDNMFARFSCDPLSLRTCYADEIDMAPEAWKAFAETRTGCIVGSDLASEFGFKVGDVIPLKGSIFPGQYELQVVGVYRSRSTSFDQSTLFFQWEYMNEVSKANDGRRDVVSVYVLVLDDPNAGPAVADAVDSMYANSPTRTRTVTERAFQAQFLSMWGNLPLFFNFLSAVALVATLMVTLNTMLLNARERIRESGVLKTLGFTSGTVGALGLIESLFLCVTGGALATVAFQSLDGIVLPMAALPLHVLPKTTIAALVISCVLGLLSGIAPSVASAKLKIDEALRRRD